MTHSVNSRLENLPATSSTADLGQIYTDCILGAAVFDLSGLPKEYYTTASSRDVSWVQTIFQALGLQLLLVSSLRLEGFRHAVVHGKQHRAIVVKQKSRYMALLLGGSAIEISEPLIRWVQEFEPSILKADSRFTVV